MGIFNWITGGSNNATKVLDAGIKGIDMLVLTPEEKLIMHKELGDQWITRQTAIADESSIRSITRRLLAVGTFGVFLFFVLAGGLSILFNNPTMAKDLGQYIIDTNLGWIVASVTVFYFGPNLIAAVKGGKY
jgi:hypothetical protein